MQDGSTPDTLDLTDHAILSQNYLINNPDVKQKYRPYFVGTVGIEPPYYAHSCWDFGDVTGRFVEGFILNRIMVGSGKAEGVEKGVRDFMLSLFHEDGLSHRGWIKDWDPEKEGDIFFWDQGRVLYGLVTWYVHEKDERVRQYIHGMLSGLKKVAIYERNFAYFPYESMYAGKYVERPDMTQAVWAASGQPIEPLVRYFEETGNQEALEFAGQLTRGLLAAPIYFFEPSGAFTRHEQPWHYSFHVHSRTAALIGLLRYGLVTGEKDLIGIGRRGYDWIKKHSSTSFGWTCAHNPYRSVGYDIQEVCCMTDMLNLAILLAEAGHERYWNDVERITRNHLIESQIATAKTYEALQGRLKHLTRKSERVEDDWSSYDRVHERAIGATDGGGWANEICHNLYGHPGGNISGCCSPHMNKGFYLAWSHIITRQNGEIRVNLSLNYNSPWVEVRSYQPYAGKVEVVVKEDTTLAVRIPDWVDKWDVKVFVGGQEALLRWQGDYVRLDGVIQGQVVTVQYPLRQTWIREDVGTASFDFEWRGDTVIDVKPRGRIVPLYQRTHMDRDEAPVRAQPIRCAPEDFHIW